MIIFSILFYSNVCAQNTKFRIEIINKDAIPISGIQRNDGSIPVSTNITEINSVLESYAIFNVEQEFPTARSPYLRRIYLFEVSNLQLMYDLQNSFPNYYKEGRERRTKINI